jgi:hypothetical protein
VTHTQHNHSTGCCGLQAHTSSNSFLQHTGNDQPVPTKSQTSPGGVPSNRSTRKKNQRRTLVHTQWLIHRLHRMTDADACVHNSQQAPETRPAAERTPDATPQPKRPVTRKSTATCWCKQLLCTATDQSGWQNHSSNKSQ